MQEIQLRKTVPFKTRYFHPFHFVVIGAGGTGGFLIPHLARLISVINNNPATDDFTHSLTIVDGDEVETHNINRQNFIQSDVGKNKAEVMAHRYAAAFGLDISVVPRYIESENDIYQISGNNRYWRSLVLIGCVDNNKTRQLIHQYIRNNSSRKTFWLDSGNLEYAGQVVLGYGSERSYLSTIEDFKESDGPHIYRLPLVTELYPDILEDDDTKFNSEMSCDERAVHAPQSISANLTAANIMMNFLNIMLTANDNEGLNFHHVKFNAKNNLVTTEMNYA